MTAVAMYRYGLCFQYCNESSHRVVSCHIVTHSDQLRVTSSLSRHLKCWSSVLPCLFVVFFSLSAVPVSAARDSLCLPFILTTCWGNIIVTLTLWRYGLLCDDDMTDVFGLMPMALPIRRIKHRFINQISKRPEFIHEFRLLQESIV